MGTSHARHFFNFGGEHESIGSIYTSPGARVGPAPHEGPRPTPQNAGAAGASDSRATGGRLARTARQAQAPASHGANMSAAALLALDPGPEHSALIRWDGAAISIKQYATNAEILALLRDRSGSDEPLAIEQVVSYGMAVGQTVFETCVWTGRFMEAYGADRVSQIPRLQVKLHLCHDSRAKDGNKIGRASWRERV